MTKLTMGRSNDRLESLPEKKRNPFFFLARTASESDKFARRQLACMLINDAGLREIATKFSWE